MKLPRILTAAVAATTLCLGGSLALTSQAAHAADSDPVQSIFFGKELLAFQCGLHGGTFYVTGSGYGCHMAGGGEIYCESGTCTWFPALRAVTPIRGIRPIGGIHPVAKVNPYPTAPVNPTLPVQQPQLTRS